MIPVNEPLLGETDLHYVTECVRTGWISSSGRFIDEFEQRWAAYCGRRYGIAVSNGTTALQLAVAALDLQPGDEIIMPSFTIISCALAAVYNGAVPVLVDSDPATWCMDVTQVEKKISERTRAIMPVHMNGHSVDMDPLMDLARRHGLKVVEDVCHAAGAQYKGHFLGTIGDAGCFSFVQNKCISVGGEGGMITTDDPKVWELGMMMANHGRGRRWFDGHKAPRVYQAQQIEVVGFNYRQNELLSAIGRIQLRYLDEWNARRRANAELYQRLLADAPHDLMLPIMKPYTTHSMLRFVAQTPQRDALKAHMERHGVHIQVEYGTPIHLDHAYQPYCGAPEGTFPVTERLAQTILTFPCYQTLGPDDIGYVVDVIKQFYRH